MPRVSIIVPVYNVEKYLRRCLDSVLAQTFTDFECILVDDGSQDGSPAICDEYAGKDSRFKVIHKAKNEKQGKARHSGIDMASSDFVFFIDSDDWIEVNALELLVNKQRETGAALVIGGIRRIRPHGKAVVYEFPAITGETNLTAYFFMNPCRNLVAKLYRKTLFTGYVVPESSIGEDAMVNVQIFSQLTAEQAAIVNTVIYNYDVTTSGITAHITPKYIDYPSFEQNPHIACRLWIERYLESVGKYGGVTTSAFCYYMTKEGIIPHLRYNKSFSRRQVHDFVIRYYRHCSYKNVFDLNERVLIEVFNFLIIAGKLYLALYKIWRHIECFVKQILRIR